MRKITLSLLVFGLIFCIPFVVFAQEEDSVTTISYEGEDAEVDIPISPESPFYFFTPIYESLEMLLTFGDDAKVEKALEHAQRRVAEMEKVAASGDTELLEKLQAKYEKHIQRAERLAAKNQEKEQEMVQRILEAQEKHMSKLQGVADRVPEQAKGSIEKVIEKAELKFKNKNIDNKNPNREESESSDDIQE